MSQSNSGKPLLRVIDALDHPHGGKILRTRVAGETFPAPGDLKGKRFRAASPAGDERTILVLGFPVTGGKLSTRRIRETGRVDLHIEETGEGAPVDLRWELYPTR